VERNQAFKTIKLKNEIVKCYIVVAFYSYDGELSTQSAERTASGCRPIEPDPDNTGGGKKKE